MIAVVDLERPDAGGVRDTLRVERGLDVDIHFRDSDFVFQAVDQGSEESGLSGTGRGHEIEKQCSVFRQHAADLIRSTLICGKDIFMNFNDSDFTHHAFHSLTRSIR